MNNGKPIVTKGQLDAALIEVRSELEMLRRQLHERTTGRPAMDTWHYEQMLGVCKEIVRDQVTQIRNLRAASVCIDHMMTTLSKLVPGFAESIQEAEEVQDGVDLELAAQAERLMDMQQVDISKLVQDNTWTEEGKGG